MEIWFAYLEQFQSHREMFESEVGWVRKVTCPLPSFHYLVQTKQQPWRPSLKPWQSPSMGRGPGEARRLGEGGARSSTVPSQKSPSGRSAVLFQGSMPSGCFGDAIWTHNG